jgi:hypothetical protein
MFELYDFNLSEIDTIIISKFEKGNNFANPLEVNYTSVSESSGSGYYIAYLETINADYDFFISIPGASRTYTMMDFKTKKEKCNSCFPYSPKSNYYKIISEYKLNGQTESKTIIKIYK